MTDKTARYRLLVENLPDAFAYHRALYDAHGEPVDYVFLELNAAFEAMTGLPRADVLGKRVTEVLPGIISGDFDWIGTFGRLASSGGSLRFENYSEPLQRHYEVTAYSDQDNHFAVVFRDITEIKVNERRLTESQKRFSQAQQFAKMGTWEYDLAQETLYWSDECASLFGLAPGEFEGTFEAFLSFVPPEDRVHVVGANQPATELREGIVLHYEHRIRRKDGAVRWVREEAGPVKEPDGTVVKMVGMVIDITEQREAENLLRLKNEQLRGVLESQSDLIVRVSLDGRFLYVNDAYCKKFGRGRDELLGRSFTPLVHPDDLDSTKAAMQKLFVEPYRAYMEQRALTVDGWRWIAWEDSVIRDASGTVFEIQGVGRDITDWKNAEAELKSVQCDLEQLVEERTRDLEDANQKLLEEVQERKRVTHALLKNNRQLKVLLETSRAMAIEKEIGPLAQRIVEGLVRLTQVTTAALYTLRDDVLHLEATDPVLPEGFPDVLRKAALVDHPRIMQSFADGRAVIIADTRLAALTEMEEKISRLRQLRSVAHLPLVYQGNPIGVLSFGSIDELHRFTAEDISVGETLAGLSALALTEANSKLAQARYIAEIEEKSKALEVAEQNLRSSQRRVEDILRHAENVAFVTTNCDLPDPKILDFSYGAERIFGYAKDEVIGKGVSLLHTAGDVKEFPGRIENMMRTKSGVSGEALLLRKGEEPFQALFKTHPLFDEQGVMWGTFGVSMDISERKQAEEQLAETLERFRKGLEGIITSMGTLMSKRDNYTAGHQLRVAEIAVAIAMEMGLEETRIEGVKLAAEVHDIGKIGIPAEILVKPGQLSELEYMIIQTHPQAGREILSDIEFPWPLADIVGQHHEKMDGSGYPDGLRGEEILLEARIICVADVVEAMASHRPYRAARGIDAALEEIERQRGVLFDRDVVDACLRVFREKGFALDQQ